MPNQYFRFKQFVIWQDRCAMKVCTEACLFGAWLADKTAGHCKMLDIGTGTGLLSAMIAQKSVAYIDAIEIEGGAAAQAEENFRNSPWSDRLKVINSSIQEYTNEILKNPGPGYDLVFSNPPFFNNDLKSADTRRNLALHSDALSFEELIDCAGKLMAPDGFFGVLIPYFRTDDFERLLSRYGFYIVEKVNIRQTPQHTYFRTMYLLCRNPDQVSVFSEIVIKDNDQKYTTDFSELLKDYYLLPDNILR